MESIQPTYTMRVGKTRSNLSGKEYRVKFKSLLQDITIYEMELATKVYIEKIIPTWHDGKVLPRDIERINQINIISVTEIVPPEPVKTPRF